MPTAMAFAVRNEAPELLEIDVYDVIGESFWRDSVSAKTIRRQLKGSKANTIRVRMNTAGGDAFDGIAISNDLRDHSARVEVDVVGLCASAGTIIMAAGDEIRIADNAQLMIHEAWSIAMGDAGAFESMVNELRRVNDGIAATYARISKERGKNIGKARFLELMAATTWMTAAEAIELGLADKKTGGRKIAAALWSKPLARATKLPRIAAQAVLEGMSGHLEELDPEELERLTAAAGARQLPLNLPGQPPATTPPTVGHNSPQQGKEDDMNIAVLAALFGLTENATEQDVTKAAKSSANFKARIETETGKQGEEAIGVVTAWKQSHEQLPGIKAALEEQKKAAESTQLDALIEGGRTGNLTKDGTAVFEDRKPRLTKAAADKLRTQVQAGEMSLAAAEGFVSVLPPVAHLSATPDASPGPQPTQVTSATGAKHTWNGKAYEQLSNVDRQKLGEEDEVLFAAMRNDWEKRGCPEAPPKQS
jgi:ATP-dependent protease ClpP protease subunit